MQAQDFIIKAEGVIIPRRQKKKIQARSLSKTFLEEKKKNLTTLHHNTDSGKQRIPQTDV